MFFSTPTPVTPEPAVMEILRGGTSSRQRLKFKRRPLTQRGSLAERAVPDLVQGCAVEGISGMILIESEGIVESLFFVDGRLASWGAAERPGESFGAFLMERGVLARARYKTLSERAEPGTNWPHLVLAEKLLSPHRLYTELVDFEVRKLRACCAFRGGEFRFEPLIGATEQIISLMVDPSRLVLDGMREGYDEPRLMHLLGGGISGFPYFRPRSGGVLERLSPTTFEARLIMMIEQRRSLEEILALTTGSRREVLAFFAGLFMMELIGFEIDPDELEGGGSASPGEVRGVIASLEGLERSQDLFELLGVDPEGSSTDIRKAFRKRTMLCHPDRLVGYSQKIRARSERIYRRLVTAEETLTDPLQRGIYIKSLGRTESQG